MTRLLVAVGDVHGDYAALARIAAAEPEATALLQIGDLVEPPVERDALAALRRLPMALVWVHGNNEAWEALDDPAQRPGHLLAPGEIWREGSVRVAGISGTHAPTWFERDKPFAGDRRRHYNHEDVTALLGLGDGGVDVLLAHEAPHGLLRAAGGRDPGQPPLDRLLRALRPQVFVSGHHHRWAHASLGPTAAFSLPPAATGYLRLRWDATLQPARLLGWERVPTPPSRQGGL